MFFQELSKLTDAGLGRLQQFKNDIEAHVESSLGLEHVTTVLGTDAGLSLSYSGDTRCTTVTPDSAALATGLDVR